MPLIQILNVTSKVYGLNNVQESTLDSALSYWSEGFIFSPRYRAGMWDGRIHCFKKSTAANPFGKFPTGLMSRVIKVLEDSQVPVQFEDLRLKPAAQPPLELKVFDPYDYQKEAIDIAVQRERGLFRVATAGGKTVLIAGILARLNIPSLVLSHRTDILVQIKSTLEKSLGQEIGHIQGDSKGLRRFNVGMIQTIWAALEKADVDKPSHDLIQWIQNDCNCIIVDEAHHLAAKQFTTLMNRALNAYYRFGVSATLGMGKNTDLSVEAGIGKIQMFMTPSDLIRQKRLSKPYIFFVDYGDKSTDEASVSKCNDCGSMHLREVVRKVGRERKYNGSDGDDVLDLKRKSYICGKCGKEWTVYSSAVARCLVENEERNNAIVRLVAERMRKRMSVLVLINFVEHGKIIHEKLSKVVDPSLIEFAWSETENRKGLLQELKEKKKLCIISTAIFGEGIDLPSLNAVVLARGSASDIDTIQSVGRALRRATGKWKTLVLDFDDESKFFAKRSKFRKKLLKEEPGFVVRDYKLK